MPTYEYECKGCGHALEVFQQMTAAPKKTCPQCHARKLVRRIGGGAGIIFKGSGFYATDYRKGSPSKDSQDSKDSKSAKDTKSTPSSSSDTSCKSGECKKPDVCKNAD